MSGITNWAGEAINVQLSNVQNGQTLQWSSAVAAFINTTGLPGEGTVTSVALSDGSTTPIYTVSGSPVTAAGTLTLTLNTQNAATVFAGPVSGAAAQPTFRSLALTDLPSIGAITLIGNATGSPATPTALTLANLNTMGVGLVADVQVFNSSGTWTKPTTGTPKITRVICIGGGGGGGSGAIVALGTLHPGGRGWRCLNHR